MNNKPTKLFYEFESFRVDVAERLLLRDGVMVPLPPKAFDTLLVLIEKSGRLIEKDELMKRLWPDTFVEEANLAHHISLLRKAFDDGSNGSKYIQTVPRRGYRWLVKVKESWEDEAPSRLRFQAEPAWEALQGAVEQPTKTEGHSDISAAVSAATTAVTSAPLFRMHGRSFKLMASLALGLVAVSLVVWWLKSRSNLPPLRVVPFTSFAGYESQPAFSPDSTRIAFVWNGEKGDNDDIYVKLVDAGTPMRLTTDAVGDFAPVWSPDGNYIAFLRRASLDKVAVYLIPSLGGPERKLSEFVPPTIQTGRSKIDWSPDGQFLAVAEQTSANQSSLFLVSIATGEKRRLTTLPAEYVGDMHPAFSPDGRTLAFTRTRHVAVSEIYLTPVAGGEARRLTFDNQTDRLPVWTSDGREIVFVSNRGGGNFRLWRVPISGGEPAPLAGLGDNVSGFAISRQGHRLAYSQESLDRNIWRVEVPASPDQITEPVKLIASTRTDLNSQYSPDGRRIAFASDRAGSIEIWVCASDGSNPFQVTAFGGHTGTPRWSPDGNYIVCDSRPGGNADIYVVKATGGQPRRLTTEDSEDIVPSWSHDGKWIYFSSNRSGDWQVWKSPAEGGAAQQVTHQGGYGPQPSPDGQYVYYGKKRDEQGPLWRVPAEGGTEEIVPGFTKWTSWICCAITERGIYSINWLKNQQHPQQAIEFFDFETQQFTIIGLFDKRIGSALSVSPEGRWLIYSQDDRSDTDIMIAENFR